MMVYVCAAGDTWDSIGRALYRDETKAVDLMQANPLLCRTTVFSGGEKIKLPANIELAYDKKPEPAKTNYPTANAPWRE